MRPLPSRPARLLPSRVGRPSAILGVVVLVESIALAGALAVPRVEVRTEVRTEVVQATLPPALSTVIRRIDDRTLEANAVPIVAQVTTGLLCPLSPDEPWTVGYPISAQALPRASFGMAGIGFVFADLPVRLDYDWGDGAHDTGSWDAAEGAPHFGRFDHVYAEPGTRTVRITATDASGRTDSYEQTIRVSPERHQLVVSGLFEGMQVREDGALVRTDTGKAASMDDAVARPTAERPFRLLLGYAGCPAPTEPRFAVSWGDGTESAPAKAVTFEHTYAAPGRYAVGLRVLAPDGTVTATSSTPITVMAAPGSASPAPGNP